MYPLPSSGSDASLTRRADVWRDIISMIRQWRAGDFTRKAEPDRSGTIWIKNNTGGDVGAGELLQITAMTQPPESALAVATRYSPVMTATTPTWHTAIDNIVIADRPVPSGEFFPFNPMPFGVIACTGDVGSQTNFIMPDPSSPKYGKRTSGGMFRVLGYDSSNNFAIVERTVEQNLWRYTLTQDSQAPSDTTATLKTLSGATFGSINLSDPDSFMSDQVNTDSGFCIQCGNKFYAIQAVCA